MIRRRRPISARAPDDLRRHERPSVTVDVVILTVSERRLEVLLVRRHHWPYEDMWAIPGGFVEPNESLEDSARRELREETNVSDVYLEQLYTFGDPGRDPRTRVITVVYYALLRGDQLHLRAGDDAADAQWFPAYEHPSLAFDHDQILEYTRQRLRSKLEYTTIGYPIARAFLHTERATGSLRGDPQPPARQAQLPQEDAFDWDSGTNPGDAQSRTTPARRALSFQSQGRQVAGATGGSREGRSKNGRRAHRG